MEKAVGNGQGKPLAGLLILGLTLLFASPSLFAAESEMIVSQPPFLAGQPFTVSFLFYGIPPDAVFFDEEGVEDAPSGKEAGAFGILEGALPPSFLIETAKKSSIALPRQGVFAASGSLAAVIEMEIIPLEAGEFEIGPFSFVAQGERVAFPAARVFVEPSSGSSELQGRRPAPFWLMQGREGSRLILPEEALGLEAGRGILIVLMAPLQAEGNVSCPAPENALLERIDVDSLDIEELLPATDFSGYSPAAAYIWTPLFSGKQSLPQAAFAPAEGGEAAFCEYAEAEVAAPQLARLPAPDSQDYAGEDTAAPAKEQSPPEKPDELSARASDSRLEASLAAEAARLWDEGQQAKAAAMLRCAESAFPFSKRIAEMRLSIDEALDVEWKPSLSAKRILLFAPLILIPLSLIILASSVISWLALCKKGGGQGAFWKQKKLIVFCSVLAAGLGAVLYTRFSGGIEEAAATGGFLRRVPDAEGAAVAALKHGAPLKIESRSQSWLYVKTLSGDAGWYPSCEIIVYTSGDLHDFW